MAEIEVLVRNHDELLDLISTALRELQASLGSRSEALAGAMRRLHLHLRVEEQLLLPAANLRRDETLRVQREHELIRELLRKIDSGLGRGTWVGVMGNLAQLRDALQLHLRFRKERMYPSVSLALADHRVNRVLTLISGGLLSEVEELLEATPKPPKSPQRVG